MYRIRLKTVGEVLHERIHKHIFIMSITSMQCLKKIRYKLREDSILSKTLYCQNLPKRPRRKSRNFVKINFIPTKTPHTHLHYVYNKHTRFQNWLRQELITQTLYRNVWRTNGQTDRQTVEWTGRQRQLLMFPEYRHGGIKVLRFGST